MNQRTLCIIVVSASGSQANGLSITVGSHQSARKSICISAPCGVIIEYEMWTQDKYEMPWCSGDEIQNLVKTSIGHVPA